VSEMNPEIESLEGGVAEAVTPKNPLAHVLVPVSPARVHRTPAPLLLGSLFVALGALGFASGIIFNRAITGLNGPQIAFFRALSGFVLFSLFASRDRQTFRVRSYRSAIPLLLGLGVSVGATATLYMTSLRYTAAATAVLLNNTAVVYVALLSPWMLKEVRPRLTWVSLALALLGMVFITDPANIDFHSDSWLGILAALATGVTYAFAMLFSRLLGGRVSGVTQSWWSIGIAALIAAPFALGAPLVAVRANWYWLLALGTLALSIPYFLYFQGLKRVNAQIVSMVGLLEPVCGVLIGMFLFQEIPNALGFLGIGMIFASILLISR